MAEIGGPRRTEWGVRLARPPQLDRLEGGAGALELVGEQPHRLEDLAEGGGGPGPVRLAEGEDRVVAQVSHDPRVRDEIGLEVARGDGRPRRRRNDLDE